MAEFGVSLNLARSLVLLLSLSMALAPFVRSGIGPAVQPFALTISPPEGLTLRIGNGSLGLTWAPPVIGSATLTGYSVYREVADDGFRLLVTLGPTTLVHIDTGLINGRTYRYRVTAFNSIEESDPSPTVQGEPDGTPPYLSIISPEGSSFIPSSEVTVSWTAEDTGSGLQRFALSLDGSAFQDKGLALSSELSDLPDGDHNVMVKAIDRAGNEFTDSVGFIVDTSPPLLQVLSPYEGEVMTYPTVVVSWTAEEAHGIVKGFVLGLDRDPALELGPDISSREVHAGNGAHTVRLECGDMAGNRAGLTVNFTVDLEPPLLKLLAPQDGSYTNSSSVICSWYSADSATGTVCHLSIDGEAPVSVPGISNHTMEGLKDGWHRVVVTSKDGAGRTAEASATFMVDTIPPVVELTGPDLDRPVPTDGPLLTWKVAESGSGVRFCYVSVDGGQFERSDRFDSASIMLERDGPHDISVMAEDRSGNRGSIGFVLTVDTVHPGILSVGPRGEDIEGLEVVWALFDEEMDPMTTELTVNGLRGISTLIDGRNASFVLLDRPVFGREYEASVNGTDLAGNPSRPTYWSFVLTDEGKLTGRVVDEDGNDVNGVTIIMDDGSSYPCRDDGTFEIEVRMGERVLYFVRSGYERRSREVLVVPGETADTGLTVLGPGTDRERSILPDLVGDPLIIFILVLCVILVLLAALNLAGWLRERGILGRRTKTPPPPSKHDRQANVWEDEGRGRKGARFRSGRR